MGGCPVFPDDNAWNRDVSGDPVASNSDALLGVMSPGNAVHLDLGTTEEYYGIPYTVVPADQPLVPITYGTDGADYSDESDPGPMPIPHDAPSKAGAQRTPTPPRVIGMCSWFSRAIACSTSCTTPSVPRTASR